MLSDKYIPDVGACMQVSGSARNVSGELTQPQTPRLLMRPLTPDDTGALYAVLSDADVTRHYPYAFDLARVQRWIAVNIERYATFGFGLWALVLRESGEMIGDCGLTMQNIDGVIRPEIGYHIAAQHRRQGYASEAARACRDWAFENTPFNRLYSYMKLDNAASIATALSCGMKRAGEYRDAENELTAVCAITRAEWVALAGTGG